MTIYNLADLIERHDRGDNLEYLFFYGHDKFDNCITNTCLSQWYDCCFTIDGIEYHTAEQYMMYQKAMLFNDTEVASEILNSYNPREYKKLGRLVRNFDPFIWEKNKYFIVVKGNTYKFLQNKELGDFLFNTGDKILVEASPFDKIWGIGLSKNNPDCKNPNTWRGSNLLGFALMQTRDILRKAYKIS